MARSVNKVILLGNIGKDAETKFNVNGTAKTTLTLATSRRWKDQASGEWKEETDWHNVTLWKMENLANYLLKGKQIYVEGRISHRKYEKDGETKYFTEIVADEVVLLGGSGEGRESGDSARPVSAPRTATASAPASQRAGSFDPGITDDDIAF